MRALERVAGLQAQWTPSLPVGLWSRAEGFEPAQLERAYARKTVVRATLMRATIHLVSTRDYLHFHPALAHAIKRKYRRPDDDPAELEAHGARLTAAAASPARGRDLRKLVDRERWYRIVAHSQLVRVADRYVAADSWLARPYEQRERALRHLVRRYLAAWGPATAADVAAWSGLQIGELRDALEVVGTRRFRDERGRTLFDVPAAPLPAPETPAPPRLLPKFDNFTLAYADRTRAVSDEHRKIVIRGGDVDAVVVVDGYVAGRWNSEGDRVALELFGGLTRTQRQELADEAARLATWLAGSASRRPEPSAGRTSRAGRSARAR